MEPNLFVPLGHFYSPMPSPEETEAAVAHAAKVGQKQLPGIAIDDPAMVSLWREIAPHMADLPFGDDQGHGGLRYHYQNDMYSYGDAAVYFGLVKHLNPNRIIEIGSGYSSALALDMRDIFERQIDLTFIEPNPNTLNTLLRDGDRATTTIIESKVQDAPVEIFDKLQPNDILFIDSSHVAKTGSDVCFEIFEILPRLQPGVIVHFHDCFWPFEYPRHWAVVQNRAWNELYFLRAFLMYNSAFDVMFFNAYFAMRHRSEAEKYQTPFLKNTGGGLWLKKVAR